MFTRGDMRAHVEDLQLIPSERQQEMQKDCHGRAQPLDTARGYFLAAVQAGCCNQKRPLVVVDDRLSFSPPRRVCPIWAPAVDVLGSLLLLVCHIRRKMLRSQG